MKNERNVTVIGLLSCIDESLQQSESIFKEDILNYLTELKSISDNQKSEKIDDLIPTLDFKNVVVENLRGNEQLLIVNIKNLNNFQEYGKAKALFFINQGEIVRSHLIVLSDMNAKHNDLISTFFNYSSSPFSYSGKLTLYSLFQDIQFFNIIEHGRLIANGNINGSKDKNPNGRTKGCIDWYLVTTYYYADGSRRTTDQYLFTTCDDECNTTRIATGRIKCGGGGGGSGTTSSPAFPTNPQNGDEYEFRYPSGRIILYKFNSTINTWGIVYVLLPDILIQSQPNSYPYLLTDGPTHDLTILAPDNFAFTFNAYTGTWKGTPLGDRPIFEYSNKCQGLQDMWNNFPNNEMYGYITADGQLIITNQLPFTGGAAFGTFTHPNGTTYYPYPMAQGAPIMNYTGMIQYPTNNPTHYLIPVVASVHTHSPCRNDGTNGVSHPVCNDDNAFAGKHPQLTHWVIGCNTIAQYDGTNNNFFNVQAGNISSTCGSIN